jgi:hypothetical protein
MNNFFSLLQATTQWRKVQERLEDDERYSRLEKIDRLDIFQVIIFLAFSQLLLFCGSCSITHFVYCRSTYGTWRKKRKSRSGYKRYCIIIPRQESSRIIFFQPIDEN